jgi:K+-sensing histidine kinase KdpD
LGTSAFLLLVQVNQHDGFLNQEWLDAWNGSLAVLQFIMPVGLTYAVLSRRIIDTGYVINRTAVFAGISIVVLGVFVLVEWALGAWVGNISRTTSIIVNVIVALALGLSIRPIHRRVEKVIDQLFFRRRHEDEAALRTFADEATFITDSNVLLDRTIEQVKKYGDLDRVAILVQNGAGTYERARGDGVQVVSENDPAILAMRASHKPADLQRYDTVVDGDRAFPMLSKGRMLGVLVCGSKSTKEPYAPDEADALAAVAHGVGFALDSLSTTPTDGRVVALLEQILAKLDGSPRSSS